VIGLGWLDDSMRLNGPTEEDRNYIADTGASTAEMKEQVAASVLFSFVFLTFAPCFLFLFLFLISSCPFPCAASSSCSSCSSFFLFFCFFFLLLFFFSSFLFFLNKFYLFILSLLLSPSPSLLPPPSSFRFRGSIDHV
jgi:hypothetical protein